MNAYSFAVKSMRHSMEHFCILVGAFLLASCCIVTAQDDGPPPLPPGTEYQGTGQPQQMVVVEELAPPVIINGKRADELTDDERREFLESKILDINHEDGEVQLIHIAPGYPITISFQEPVQNMLLADSSLISVQNLNEKTLVLRAQAREGDTSLQVFFHGNKLRVYHIFVQENMGTAETAIRVASFGAAGWNARGGGSMGWMSPHGMLDVRSISQIIRNYDALMGERAINSRMVRRTPLFRTSQITAFTTYYIYQFASGPAAVSFAYTNPYPYAIRYDESRLRIAIGNVRYIPDYVSFHKNILSPGESTTGFAVVGRPAFRFDQPFDLVWK